MSITCEHAGAWSARWDRRPGGHGNLLRVRFTRYHAAEAVLAVAGVAALVLTACLPTTTHGHPRTSISVHAGTRVQAAKPRPNIVFVLADDLAMNLVSHMPHVQAMMRDGTSLSRYYVVDSLCCPSRAAIFTGQYPHDDGVFDNHGSDGGLSAYTRHRDQQKAFVLPLHAAGYRTGFMGKYLNGYQPNLPQPPGWDEWDAAGNGYHEFDYSLDENGTQHHYGHRPKDYLTDVVSAKAGRFIDSAAQRRQPFMLEVATFAPHSPYIPAPRDAHADPTVRYPRTPGYAKQPTNAPSWLRALPRLSAADNRLIERVYRQRVRSVLAIDQMIGHLQQRLQADGVARDTYVVFSSDNGYHQGEYELLPGKQTAYDTDIHVPLVVTGPGVPAGHVSGQLATNIDLGPTFTGITGTGPMRAADGVSLAPLWHGDRPPEWQRAVLVEHHGPNNVPGDPDRQSPRHGAPPSYAAVRTADALYVRYHDGEQEYYDTSRDPYELDNLAARGVPRDLVRTMRALQHCHGATACQRAARLTTG